MNDLTALMELMTECGISTEQLLNVGEDAVAAAPTASEGLTPTLSLAPPADIDPAAAAAVSPLLGLDPTTVDCMVAAEAGGTDG